ncbi:hypothetical protein C8Q75DRAFT_620825 [Abortiporus biennis]|nr:hypothetical protein C8Q75DRAFT_620825 [Abortiporus biennis]
MTKELVWLITGTSSGLGRRLVDSVIARGDKVIATARSLEKLDDLPKSDNLRILQLDVTDGPGIMRDKINEALKLFGRIDVLVNNAGISIKAISEEGTSALYRQEYDTNVFGLLDVTHAVLPHMRERKSGTIVLIGSRSSWRARIAGLGLYASSKAAVHVIGEVLSVELAPFSIRVLIVEPAVFKTEGIFGIPLYEDNTIPDYEDLRKRIKDRLEHVDFPNDPRKGMDAVVDVVRGEGRAQGKKWPLYLPLGPEAEEGIRDKFEDMDGVLKDYHDLIHDTRFESDDQKHQL